MGQQEFDNFKQRIKEWMETHPEEYDCFEETMNRKDNAGYEKILRKAFSNSFEKNSRNSIIPAMLAWLYFGKSFERMVERGEEIRKNPNAGYVHKLTVTSTIKMLVSRSISLGLRTKADWEEHDKQMKIADSNHVMDWAINGTIPEKKKAGRKSEKPELPEYMLPKIGNFLKTKNEQRDIACLKIALEEMNLLKPKNIKSFRDYLQNQYERDIQLIDVRGIQDVYKELTSLTGAGQMVKDMKENRKYIDGIKKLLTN